MVHFVFLLQPPEDGDGVLHRRLGHHDGLEAALQGGVLFDVLAVLVDGGGADAMQFPPGQGRLDHVGGVHGALRGPGAHQGVELIDEHDDLAVGLGHLFEHRLEAVFEFAPELGPGNQRPHIQGHQALVFQALGHVAVDDALGQAFHDGGLAHPGFADEHRVVLGAPGEHLDDPPDFAVPADHRVQLAGPGHFGQIPAVFLQGLKFLFRGLVGDPLRPPEVRQGLEDGLGRQPLGPQQPARLAGLVRGQGPEQVLGGDVIIFHLAGLFQGVVQGLIQARGDIDLGLAAHLGQPGQEVIHPLDHVAGIDLQFFQEGADQAVLLGQEGAQQVGRLDLGVAQLPGQFLGPLQGLLGFIG